MNKIKKRNANDICKEGFTYNKTSKRYKSFMATVDVGDGKGPRRRRISFERTITTLKDAKAERKKILSNYKHYQRVDRERLEYIEKIKKYKDFLDEFYKWRCRYASKTTADNNLSYLKNWGFKFFVDVKGESDYRHWPYHYEEFKVWLSSQKSTRANVKSKDSRLSTSAQNNVIRAINAFFKFIEPKVGERILRCRTTKMEPVKGRKNLVGPDEFTKLREFAYSKRELSDEYLLLLRETGMRAKEALGLCSYNIALSRKSDKKQFIHDALNGAKIPCYGFIMFKRQLLTDTNAGELVWGPLKHRDGMTDRNMRYVPIMSEELAQVLKNRLIKFKQNKDALLFGDISYSFSRQVFDEFYRVEPVKKTLHDLRHTFITDMVLKMGGDISLNLAKDIWGHSDYKTLMNYVHLAEGLVADGLSRATLENIEDLEIKQV